jgi:hypothetical protein
VVVDLLAGQCAFHRALVHALSVCDQVDEDGKERQENHEDEPESTLALAPRGVRGVVFQ